MAEDFSKKTVLVVDSGIFHNWTIKLAKSFGRVLYYSPWQGAFPSQRQTRLGEGFPGVERCNYPQAIEDEIDLFIFCDLFQADWQVRLAKQGRRVWGARFGEAAELERWEFRKWCERNGLRTSPAELVTGTDALRAYLKDKNDVYIKAAHGINRGDGETVKWKGQHLGSPRLDQRVYDLGAFQKDTEFVVEQEVKDSIELGEDLLTVDGAWPDHAMMGMEIKGLGTVGTIKPYAAMPACLRDFNAKIGKVFKADQVRSCFSMEGMYNAKHEYYPTDPCMRFGSPSNELLGEMFEGWPETFWHGAEGKLVSPKPVAKFGIVVMGYNETSGNNFQPITYPAAIDRWVKLRNPYALHGKRYAVPQGSPTNLFGVVGTGDSLLAAAKALGEHVKQIDSSGIEIATDALTKMLDTIEKTKKFGVPFTTEALPSGEELKKAVE